MLNYAIQKKLGKEKMGKKVSHKWKTKDGKLNFMHIDIILI